MFDASLFLLPLAQSDPSSTNSPVERIWIMLIVVVVVAVVVALFAGWIRRKAMMEPGPSIGFTLSDLRDMRAEGQLSEEEFQATKAKILARTKESLLDNDELENPEPQPPRTDLGELSAPSEDDLSQIDTENPNPAPDETEPSADNEPDPADPTKDKE